MVICLVACIVSQLNELRFQASLFQEQVIQYDTPFKTELVDLSRIGPPIVEGDQQKIFILFHLNNPFHGKDAVP